MPNENVAQTVVKATDFRLWCAVSHFKFDRVSGISQEDAAGRAALWSPLSCATNKLFLIFMATKNTYDCSKCPGYCCSYDYIETKASDVTRLAKHHGLPVATAREKFTRTVEHEGKTLRVLRHRKDHVYKSMCMFFDQDERRCTIYEGRPQVCRDYPNGSTCGYYNFIKFERKHQGDESFIPSA